MQRYVAFLRAINVGGHTVKMDRLRTLFDSLGFHEVETFIASGNIVFESPSEDAPALEQQIEQHLQHALGYPVATFVRSTATLPVIAHREPFSSPEPGTTGYALSIAFLKAPPGEEARQKLMRFRTEIDDFHLHEREVYWMCRTKVSESTFSGALLEKAIGAPATMRNATTVRKLAAKYSGLQ